MTVAQRRSADGIVQARRLQHDVEPDAVLLVMREQLPGDGEAEPVDRPGLADQLRPHVAQARLVARDGGRQLVADVLAVLAAGQAQLREVGEAEVDDGVPAAGNAPSSCSGVAMRVLSRASRSRAMTRLYCSSVRRIGLGCPADAWTGPVSLSHTLEENVVMFALRCRPCRDCACVRAPLSNRPSGSALRLRKNWRAEQGAVSNRRGFRYRRHPTKYDRKLRCCASTGASRSAVHRKIQRRANRPTALSWCSHLVDCFSCFSGFR